MLTQNDKEQAQGMSQEALIEIATSLINQPIEKIDKAILNTLEQIALTMKAFDISINYFDEIYSDFKCLYRWSLPEKLLDYGLDIATFDYVRKILSIYQRDPIVITDIPEQSGPVKSGNVLHSHGVATLVVVPMLEDSKFVGFVSISWEIPTQLDNQTLSLLKLVGAIFLNALNRKRTEETARATHNLEREHCTLTEALLDSAMVLTSSLQLDEVANRVLRSIYQVTPHDFAHLVVLEGDEALTIGSRSYVSSDLDYTLITPRFNWRDDYLVARMAETYQPVIIGDVRNAPDFKRISQNPMLRSYLGIPIIRNDEMIGVIDLGSQIVSFFNEMDTKYITTFATQAGIAIENAQLYEQAKTIAIEERQRLARELHDSVTQTLFSANMLAEALPKVMVSDPTKGLHYLQDLHQLTRGAMAEMRSLLVELRPETIARTDLSVLMAQLCDVFTGKTQVEVTKKFNKQVILPIDLQMAFYRMAQETLSNIAKHAHSTHVQFELLVTDTLIKMYIKDDGQGFDVAGVSADHFGLVIMKERATNVGAKLSISSQIGSGTEISVKWKSGR